MVQAMDEQALEDDMVQGMDEERSPIMIHSWTPLLLGMREEGDMPLANGSLFVEIMAYTLLLPWRLTFFHCNPSVLVGGFVGQLRLRPHSRLSSLR